MYSQKLKLQASPKVAKLSQVVSVDLGSLRQTNHIFMWTCITHTFRCKTTKILEWVLFDFTVVSSQQATKTLQLATHTHIRNGGCSIMMCETKAHDDQVLDAWRDFASCSDVNIWIKDNRTDMEFMPVLFKWRSRMTAILCCITVSTTILSKHDVIVQPHMPMARQALRVPFFSAVVAWAMC